MKFLPLILSLYILMLAVTPCTDGQECGLDLIELGDHEHSDHEDACTPFCTCHCCGTTVSFTDIVTLKNFEPNNNFHYSIHYNFTYAYDHFGSVWHPPILI